MIYKRLIIMVLLLGFGAWVMADSAESAPNPPPIYSDITTSSGTTMAHTGVNLMSIGGTWIDYNTDGLLDLYMTDTSGTNKLFHNNGDGTFGSPSLSIANSVALINTRSGGVNAADYDNDGDRDLFVANHSGDNALLRNDGASGFTHVTQSAGLAVGDPSVHSAWADINGDGWLDLYVLNYGASTIDPANADYLFMSNGDGTFNDISGVLPLANRIHPGLAVAFLDYDNDQDADLYVINDKHVGNVLYRNDGAGCGGWCMTDVSVATNTNTQVDGMGIAVGDYDLDGDLDLYFSDGGPMVLLQNQTAQGSPTFLDVSTAAGVDFNAIGWGTIMYDVDNDGWLDMYVATHNAALAQTDRLYHNNGDGTFSDISNISGVSSPDKTMVGAVADFNEDGFIDIATGNWDDGYKLYQNSGSMATGNKWIRFNLVGGNSINQDAIGSRVELTLNDGRVLMQEVKSGSSYGAGNDLALHFGLGYATITQAEIQWSNGEVETVNLGNVNQEVTFEYSKPTAIELAGAESQIVSPFHLILLLIALLGTVTLIPVIKREV